MRKSAEVYELMIRDYNQSLQLYQRAVSRFRDNRELLTEVFDSAKKIGEITVGRKKDLSAAVLEYEKALQEIPNLSSNQKAELRFLVAHAYYTFDDFQQSRIEAARVLRIVQTGNVYYDQAVILIARCHFLAREIKEAKDFLESKLKNIVDADRSIEASFLLAQILEESADYDKALSLLNRIRNRYPNPKVIDYGIRKINERREETKKVYK